MKAYTWDEIGAEVREWDVPDYPLRGSDGNTVNLLAVARHIDVDIAAQIDENLDSLMNRDATFDEHEHRVYSLVGTFGDRGHQCGLYFGPHAASARRKADEDLMRLREDLIDSGMNDEDGE